MNVTIEAIPHNSQRYQTCGDWFYDAAGNMIIRISKELPQKSQDLVAIHEYAEARMCAANGITQSMVDDYDFKYEANRAPDDESEPGDHTDAPYYQQHQLATQIEKMIAAQIGVNWEEHEAAINKLFEATPAPVMETPIVSETPPPTTPTTDVTQPS